METTLNGGDAVGGIGSWRPIDTAPKDGAEVLASDGRSCWLARWVDSVGEWDTGTTDGYGNIEYAWGLTHWMPLPDPPAAGDPSNGDGR